MYEYDSENLDVELDIEDKKVAANAGKGKKGQGIIIVVLLIICFFVLAGATTWTIIRSVGKSRLKNSVELASIDLVTPETASITAKEKEIWKEGWVKYNDKIYEYNDNIITFLCMGIDKEGVVKEVAEGANGGQADALFLVVFNSDNQTTKVVGINRNTMVGVDIFDEDGNFVSTVDAQIATQHGFGNGVEESCQYQINAVRRLMYNLPIHGYAALNMKAIPIINDSVGGVEVVALSDVHYGNKKVITEGEEVLLNGDQAYLYVRDRESDEFASADVRLSRQKQYLTAFLTKAKTAASKDISLVGELYNDITPYMTTNVTFDEVMYIAPEIVNYSFDSSSFYMIKGETVMGEKFEEFYPDEDELYDLIIDVFYKEVDVR
ncbi:MAG: LCP family protein [Lachnospiraceae bacterium]|nr:LCP family protein [Lachnospiraceae bacterium]